MSSEAQTRSQAPTSRGRGGGRGGRGGSAGRGGASTRRANGDKAAAAGAFDEDDSDISQLRKLYGDSVGMLRELFPDWSDADILYALQETDGDMGLAAERISEGTISQWGEVSKQKKPSTKTKAKEFPAAPGAADVNPTTRSARGRPDGARGGRGARGSERARGGRGRATTHTTTNGHRNNKENEQLSVPTDESPGWGNAWGNNAANETTTKTADTTNATPVPAEVKPAAPAGKSWASMLRQSTAPPKPAPKPKEAPAPEPEPVQPPPAAEPVELESNPKIEEPSKTETPTEKTPVPAEVATPKVEPEVALPPPEDDLTKPQPQSTTATPLSASQAQHATARPAAASGFAATALKATERPAARAPSYQRRILDQEEAVRMPGNREVDRAAVQFGAFSLNGTEDDIDGDREEPETRAQPPQESPAAPRAALPPVAQPASVPEPFSQQKPSAVTPVAPPTGPAATTQQPAQGPSGNQHLGRFAQSGAQEPAGFPQKPYDSFAQQNAAPSSAAGYESFTAPTTQAPGPNNAFSSGPGDYSSYYTADPQSRNAYNNYYGQQYGQQGAQAQEAPGSNNRGFGGYNASQNDHLSQYPQSGAQPSRFGATAADAQNSGHNTPNPVAAQHQPPTTQAAQPHQQQQPHGNQYGYGNHPYYNSPFYAQYMNQYGGYGGQAGYGGAPYGKGGYGQPHQYGMNPQGPYDHVSSPATSGFGGSSLAGRDSGVGSSIDTYGRAGSAQSGGIGGGFGGMHDSFGRASNYPQAGQGFGAAGAQAAGANAGVDDLKPYGDSKTAAGPSPSLTAAARPGSATNTTPAASGLPPPQTTQPGMGGYGGYPNHLQSHGLHGNQSNAGYGLGGSGGQGQGNNPYSGYGGNQGFGNYYGRHNQGGWGGNYH